MYVQSFDTHLCMFLLRVRAYVYRSLPKIFGGPVIYYELKFHEDSTFHLRDICKIEHCGFFCHYAKSTTFLNSLA